MVAAALELQQALDSRGRKALTYPVDAAEWQTRSNPKFMQFDTGVPLEFQPPEVQQKALVLVQ